MNSPGVTVSPPLKNKAGLKGLDVCDVTFKDVQIPKVNQLGAHGQASHILAPAFGRSN